MHVLIDFLVHFRLNFNLVWSFICWFNLFHAHLQRRSEAIDGHLNEFLGRVREHTHRVRASASVAVASLQFARTGEYDYQAENQKFPFGEGADDGVSGDPSNAMDSLCRVLSQTQKLVESLAPRVLFMRVCRMWMRLSNCIDSRIGKNACTNYSKICFDRF